METSRNPYRESGRAARWGIGVSLVLGGVKLVGGLSGHSLALLSDAVHSLVDAAVSAALLVALYLAQRPADREHPYGHARVEAVAGAGVAVVLPLLALGVGPQGLATPEAEHTPPAAHTAPVARGGSLLPGPPSLYMGPAAPRQRS